MPGSRPSVLRRSGSRESIHALISAGLGRRPRHSGKELVLAKAVLHPERERQTTEVGRCGTGVWFERRSLAWLQAPCAEQWLQSVQAD
jgi:hypothetical protein